MGFPKRALKISEASADLDKFPSCMAEVVKLLQLHFEVVCRMLKGDHVVFPARFHVPELYDE